MAQKLETDIVINLAGNLVSKAKRYGNSMADFARKNSKAMTLLNTSIAASSRGIDTFGNRAVLGAGVVAVAFERTFVKTAAEFERYQIMLNKLQGSEEAGAKALSWIEDFTQNTPYAVKEVMDSFIRLKAFGIDPMDGTMQAIADQAAMMGGTAESVDGIALALGQAWTKGKLQGEEALQLLERGVPVWDYLIKASKELGHNNGIGYTAAQLQDMASKGLLTRDAIKSLIQEMGKASEGSAKKQMDSWSGMVSNMGDSWTIFKKDVMDGGAFTVLKDELGEFLAQLDRMKETGEYDELVEKVGTNLVEGFRTAAEAARGVKEVGQELLPVLSAIGDGASAIAEAVGGYGNLAKILASVYALNKAVRIGAPLLKGAISMGGIAGGAGKGGINSLGATPVYVVNMGQGGIGGGTGGVDAGSGKQTKAASKIGGAVNNLLKGGIVAYGLSMVPDALPKLRRDESADPNDLVANMPGLLDAYDGLRKWWDEDSKREYRPRTRNRPSISEMANGLGGQDGDASTFATQIIQNIANPAATSQLNGQIAVDVQVSDDRVRATARSRSPFISIDKDPDAGQN